MVSGKIADGTIKIVLAGYDVAKTQLSGLQTQLKQLNAGMAAVGSASSKGFAVASGGITSLLKAADPVRFEIFTQKIQILAMYLGQALIPILANAIKQLDKMIEVVKNLTNEQKDQILHWTKVALVVLAAGTALGVVATILPTVTTLVQGLAVAIKLLTSGPLGVILLLLGAAAAAFLKFGDTSGGLTKILEPLGELFGKIAGVVGAVLAPVLDYLMKIFEAFGPLLATLFDLFMQLLPPLASLGKALGEVLLVVGELVGSVLKLLFNLLGEILVVLADVANELLKAFGPVLIEAVKIVVEVLKGALEIIKGIVQAAKDLVDILDSLNPFSSSSSGGAGNNDTGAGDYRHSSGSGGDFGGGDGGKKKTEQLAPLARPVRVEQFGLEDAFKRAQQGASFDPAKLAQNELKKLQQEQLAAQKQIEENTRKQNAAQLAF